MNRLRVLVADDHELIRSGLRKTIEVRAGWEICAEACTGREAVEKAKACRPDVVIMDFSMPDLNGLEATRQIRRALPQTEVLILTMHDSEQLARSVLAAGARGYLLKNDAGATLVTALENLAQHKPFFTPKITEMVLQGYLDPAGSETVAGDVQCCLTPRETEVVQLIAEGKSSKEIAGRLELSVHTVETHRTNLMRKLGVHSASELVRYAIRNKIIEA